VSDARFTLASEAATVALGSALAGAATPGLTIYLSGELGAGKTTLTRGIAQGLGHLGAVKSPTYTLVEPYEQLAIPLYHFDLYRLGDAQELEYLGVRDYFSGRALLVVEWPGRGAGVLPSPDLHLHLAVRGTGRELALEALSDAGQRCLDRLKENTTMGDTPLSTTESTSESTSQ
jgi:tRNA threonylcarbamoyladenosine biosynthesis protein TsaE